MCVCVCVSHHTVPRMGILAHWHVASCDVYTFERGIESAHICKYTPKSHVSNSHAHMHTCNIMHTHAHVQYYAHTCNPHVCTHTHTHTHAHTHTHTHTHAHTHTHTHTHRPRLGRHQFRSVHLHRLQWDSPESGGPRLQGEVYPPRPVDRGTCAGTV